MRNIDSRKPLTAAEIEELRELRIAAQDYAGDEWNAPSDYADCDGGWDGCIVKIEAAKNKFICAAFNAFPRLLAMLTPPADASGPVEIFSAVTCNECKRAWVGYRGCLTEPLPCGHMRSQWAVGSAVVDDMVAASCARNKSMEDVDDDDEE